MSDLVDDRKMSDTEGLMWRLERDPLLSSTFANVSILDRPPDVDRLRRRMERTAGVMPRLRQVVRESPGNLAPPVWIDDPEFDIHTHVRRLALPSPGDERQLLDLASLIAADPLDRSRPLWQFTVVEGLRGGRAALIEKLHHTIGDGERGVRLALECFDFERDAPEPPPLTPDGTADGEGSDEDAFVEDPTAVAVRDVLAGALRLPLGVAREVRDLLAEPERIADASASANQTLQDLVRRLGNTEPARSPLWSGRSTRRRLEVATAPLAETSEIAKRLGGTLNTAFLTIAAEAAGRYHAALGAPIDSLRASMAISTRTERSGANAFSVVRLLVPVGDLEIDERFRAIDALARAARDEDAAAPLDRFAALASTLPSPLVSRLARQQARTVDFATSNVRGSSAPMFIAGARLLHNYPIGPLAGVAFNLTLLSYEDHLDMGINIDPAAVGEPELLSREVAAAAARLTTPRGVGGKGRRVRGGGP